MEDLLKNKPQLISGDQIYISPCSPSDLGESGEKIHLLNGRFFDCLRRGSGSFVQMFRKVCLVFICVVALNAGLLYFLDCSSVLAFVATHFAESHKVLQLMGSWKCVLGLLSAAFIAEKIDNIINMF